MNSIPTSEVLDLAADEIEARGWTQGSGWDWSLSTQDPLCLEGAIGVASGIRNPLSEAPFNTCPAGAAVREYLEMRAYDHRWTMARSPVGPLYAWNDITGRTQQDVIEVLRAAAAVERVKEATVSRGYETEDQPLPLDEKAVA